LPRFDEILIIFLLWIFSLFLQQLQVKWLVGFMVFNATFNNISVISWRSVLLVEEAGGPGENHRPVASH
jgi:predicted permease